MPIAKTIIGGVVPGLQHLARALDQVTANARTAAESIRALDVIPGAVGVGRQNAIEAEIMRRMFTRTGGARGLVGVQNATEAEIQRRQVTRTLSLVGRLSATEAEIFRRCVTVTVKRSL